MADTSEDYLRRAKNAAEAMISLCDETVKKSVSDQWLNIFDSLEKCKKSEIQARGFQNPGRAMIRMCPISKYSKD